MSARDRILNRIRTNAGRTGPISEAEMDAVRSYLAQRPLGPRPDTSWPDVVARFQEQAEVMACTVDRVATRVEIPAAVARYIVATSLQRTGVCWAALGDLDWRAAGLDIAARGATGDDKIGITSCFCALAETGTLMLTSSPDTQARTSLLPETHVAIVPVDRILATMEDGFALYRKERGEPPRAINFVSGPSRTADIEQTLVLGAHGPYRVHVILLG